MSDTATPDLKTRVQELIDTMINPAVAGHGGFVELIDVQDNRVYLTMGGGCQGCGAADVTLKAGIERLIKEELPEVSEVLDTTDHSQGVSGCGPARRPPSPPRATSSRCASAWPRPACRCRASGASRSARTPCWPRAVWRFPACSSR